MKIRGTIGERFCARVLAASAAWAVLASPAPAQLWGEGEEDNGVNMSEYGTVDLAVQDTDLHQVLEMLSIQGRKNIITSKNVSATVSANLYDVTFYEALEAILSVNGYTYREEGNFIYVLTQEELVELEAATRVTQAQIFKLEYLSATDAAEFIAPLLSEAGRSTARGETQPGFQPDIADGGGDGYAYEPKLVVNDYPENLEQMQKLLTELDTPPQQVLLEATILQTTLDESNAYGVDFSIIADMDFLNIANPLSPVNSLLSGDNPETGFQPADNKAYGIQSTVGNTTGAGGFKVGVVTDEISVFLKLLDEVTDLSVLARPKIMALNRQRAEVLVGARVGYLSTTATQTTTTQTVQFLDTGIQLVFRPFISRNGMVRLELSPSVSEASLRTVTDAQGLQVTIPDELTNEMTTNVRIKDGQTLVLGGLFRESVRVSRRQVPFLGDIPLINLAFTGQDDVVDRDEIIFLITPSVVHDEGLWEIGNDALNASDAIRVGARSGLLPFSREQMTNNYNRKAMAAFRAGNVNMARHWCNTSLGLNKNQPEMLLLRQEITGKKSRAFERGIMESTFRGELGPLPRERAMLPREVAGIGAMNFTPDFGPATPPTQPARPVAPVRPQPQPRPQRPEQPEVDDTMIDDKTSDATTTEPAPVAPREITRDVPRISANPKFWQADNPAAFDDPAWKQTEPFATFDHVDAAGDGSG